MIGERLAEIRADHHHTQKDLADALGVCLQSVRNWEQGRNDPPNQTLVRICQLYGTSADYLLGISDYDPSGEERRRKSRLTKDELAALHDYEKYLLWKRKTASR